MAIGDVVRKRRLFHGFVCGSTLQLPGFANCFIIFIDDEASDEDAVVTFKAEVLPYNKVMVLCIGPVASRAGNRLGTARCRGDLAKELAANPSDVCRTQWSLWQLESARAWAPNYKTSGK